MNDLFIIKGELNRSLKGEKTVDYSAVYTSVKDAIVNAIQVDNNSIISTATRVLIGDGSKVLTCTHCVNGSKKNGIYYASINHFHEGKIIFCYSKNDVAIIDMNKSFRKGLTIRNSINVEIGNEVFTVGFPYYATEKTLNAGNIAAFEKELIKIDTSVNNGNSGGPLLNVNGEIIG